jgi:hypothetical protein
MTKKTTMIAGSLTCLLGVSQAAVVELWDFEDGTDGQAFTPAGSPNGTGGSTGANGTLMRGWDTFNGPSWTSTTSVNGGSLGMRAVNQDGYLTEGSLHNWSSSSWTVELSVNFNDLSGWETMIGRDGSTIAENESDFYFQRMGDGSGLFRLNYVDNDNNRRILPSTKVPVTGTWYGMAAVVDGAAGTISLYLDDGSGYALDSQLTGLTGDLGLKNSALNWTFSRGWYAGGFVDHTDASYDNIRFSDTALAPSELIAVNPVPEPAASALLGLGCLALLRRRR